MRDIPAIYLPQVFPIRLSFGAPFPSIPCIAESLGTEVSYRGMGGDREISGRYNGSQTELNGLSTD